MGGFCGCAISFFACIVELDAGCGGGGRGKIVGVGVGVLFSCWLEGGDGGVNTMPGPLSVGENSCSSVRGFDANGQGSFGLTSWMNSFLCWSVRDPESWLGNHFSFVRCCL